MPLSANNTNRKSWINVPEDSDFPIQNIPFGVFITKDDVITIGTRIGNCAIDMGALQQLNDIDGFGFPDAKLMLDTRIDFKKKKKKHGDW